MLSPVTPTVPVEPTRNLSTPAVSTVNVSADGNLIFVSVSPECIIFSGMVMSFAKLVPAL